MEGGRERGRRQAAGADTEAKKVGVERGREGGREGGKEG